MPRKKGDAARQLRQPWVEQRTVQIRRSRATFHLPADLLSEVRDTVVALSGPPEQLTMSKFAESALRREVERLQNLRPGADRGKPFAERRGQVRRGRPLQ
jgi:hypothetical protein